MTGRLSRREFLEGAAVGGAMLAAHGLGRRAGAAEAENAAVRKATRPNIICILADDYGISGMGCYGGSYKTPHLDALAAGGVRFDHCYTSPWCGPSRAALLMGRYAFRTGVNSNGGPGPGSAVPPREICFANVLTKDGYATTVAGKWSQLKHMGSRQEGLDWGFDEFMVWIGAPKIPRYWNPTFSHNGQKMTNVQDKFGPDLLQEFVFEFINRNKDRPFCVYYPMVLVHGPLERTPDSVDDKDAKNFKADNIAYMDKLVGKLLDELDRLKLREKTLVVFMGDNGMGGRINGREIPGRKGRLSEGGCLVPFIANWKGTVPAGRVCSDLVDFTDFLPTFAEVAGAKLPADRKFDGRSFAPQLRGEAGTPRDWVYVQSGQDRFLRDKRWKLTGDGALFDMRDAPFKEIPVAAGSEDAEALAARKKLQAVMDDLRAQDEWAEKDSPAKEKPAKSPKGKAKASSKSGE